MWRDFLGRCVFLAGLDVVSAGALAVSAGAYVTVGDGMEAYRRARLRSYMAKPARKSVSSMARITMPRPSDLER